MAYAVCVRARILEQERWRDNSLTGTMLVDGETYRFKTRSHLTKAVNSQFSDVSWKPQASCDVIFDGEIFRDQIVIDHLEPWRPEDFFPLGRHENLVERMMNEIPKMPEMTKLMRHREHHDEGFDIRFIRWMKTAKFHDGKKACPAILEAIIADGEMRFCVRSRSQGEIVDIRNAVILPVIAETLGIPKAEIIKSGTEKAPDKEPQRATANRNKWIPGKPYRPIGMPEIDPFDEHAPSLESYDDIPF